MRLSYALETRPRRTEAVDALVAMTPRTRAAAAGAGEVLNLGSAANLQLPFPLLIERAEGAYVYDLDDNRYIDTMLGFGTHVLGHRTPEVENAMRRQLEKGWLYGIHNAGQERLARLLIEAAPAAERVIFCNSGTEATMYAMRVARAFTVREKIAIFDGSYHGAHDYGQVQADPESPRDRPWSSSRGAGIPAALLDLQVPLPYREEAALGLIEEHRDSLAAVMIEAVQSSNPSLTEELGAFLHKLQAFCRKLGILFIIDEVITGFRIAYGGVQEHYGLKPDLATYAKALGGGAPIGAVAGRTDIMALFQGLGSDPKAIFSGGSFSGNPMSMAAGTAHVEALRAQREQVYPYINAQGARLTEAFNHFAREQNMAVQMLNAGSMFQLFFRSDDIRSVRDLGDVDTRAEGDFYLHLLRRGVLVPGTKRAFLSAAHTPALIDYMVAAMKNALLDLRADGGI